MDRNMRRHAPAALRNRQPIAEFLATVLPETGVVLEVAAGSGQHAIHFAERFGALSWQPTDLDPEALASIDAWVQHSALGNVRPALRLDASAPWKPQLQLQADAIFNANMIHISPIAATKGLFAGAAEVLNSGAPLITYGPYKIDGAHTSESNAAFDASLKGRDPRWGVRDLGDLETIAQAHGFRLKTRQAMPANNFCLVWRHEH